MVTLFKEKTQFKYNKPHYTLGYWWIKPKCLKLVHAFTFHSYLRANLYWKAELTIMQWFYEHVRQHDQPKGNAGNLQQKTQKIHTVHKLLPSYSNTVCNYLDLTWMVIMGASNFIVNFLVNNTFIHNTNTIWTQLQSYRFNDVPLHAVNSNRTSYIHIYIYISLVMYGCRLLCGILCFYVAHNTDDTNMFRYSGRVFKKQARPEVSQIITVLLIFLQVNWIWPQAPPTVTEFYPWPF